MCCSYFRRNKNRRLDRKDLTRRSKSSSSSGDDNEGFHEVVYPAYPTQMYPAYIEAPGEYFTDGIPKRHHNKYSDPTLSSLEREERRARKKDMRNNGFDNAIYTA